MYILLIFYVLLLYSREVILEILQSFINRGDYMQLHNVAGSSRRTYLELQLRARTNSKQSPVFKSSLSKLF